MYEKYYIFISTTLSVIVLLFVLWRVKVILDLLRSIINDTLKTKEGKWSRTSIMMASAWASVEIVFFTDYFQHGLNQWTFGLMVASAGGAKVLNAYSNKVDPLVQPPTSTTTVQQDNTTNSEKTTITEDKQGEK